MPDIQTVRRVVRELEAEGQSVSIESVRAKSGGSPRDIGPILKTIRAEQATPAPVPAPSTDAAPITWDRVCEVAYELKLSGGTLSPEMVYWQIARNRQPAKTEQWMVWAALLPEANPDEARLLDWHIANLRDHRVSFVQGHEYTDLEAIWQRLVVADLPSVSDTERDAWIRKRFAEMAHAGRQ